MLVRIHLLLMLALMFANRPDAQASDAARLLTLINQARVSAGLAPLALNPQLAAAAQAHADDMARNGLNIGHMGSDGSTPAIRMLRAGYRPYSWGSIVGENWAAYRTLDESISEWMSDTPHRENILRPEFREIGVGVAQPPSGGPILVTDFGTQPNVLPVFLIGSGPTVTLILTNEDAAPGGDGPNVMGRAVDVEISTDAGFSHIRTEHFAGSIRYSSPDGEPVSTIYVRFHDASGRSTVSTATAWATIVSPADAPSSSAANMPTRKSALTPRAGSIVTSAPPRPSATLAPTQDLTTLPAYNKMLGASPSATPTAIGTAIVRRALAPPASVSAVPAATAKEPIVPVLTVWLFAELGLLLLLAAVALMRMHIH